MNLDPAVLSALGLDPSKTTVSSHGGSGFSSTSKISTTNSDGSTQSYFMKTGRGREAAAMMKGEYTSLNALHNAVPSLAPRALSHGPLTDAPGMYHLTTDFLDLRSGSSGSGPSLARKLAQLHTAPSPDHRFGFPVATCCGSTAQDNTWENTWPDFYAKRRLLPILAECERRNGQDKELRGLVENMVEKVVPRLLGALGDVNPALVHGDLWSGNAGGGAVVFDPSSCYAHSEYELGIMKMFGGFGPAFLKEYHSIVPKSEPVKEYDDRIRLYMLYHQLNHHALFGSGYRSGAISIMKKLKGKYGGENNLN